MNGHRHITVGVLTILALVAFVAAAFAQVDLNSLLVNAGFEDDLIHSHWTSTMPNEQNYDLDATQVNPVIIPHGSTTPLSAYDGANFLGVVDTDDTNASGKLVHTVVMPSTAAGTTFTLTVAATRGRLNTAPSGDLRSAGRVLVTIYGWGPGAIPEVNPATDNWSRRPDWREQHLFGTWGAPGTWAVESFSWTTAIPLDYVTVGISAQNKTAKSYVAFDLP